MLPKRRLMSGSDFVGLEVVVVVCEWEWEWDDLDLDLDEGVLRERR
jgi:hypothetical protein